MKFNICTEQTCETAKYYWKEPDASQLKAAQSWDKVL